MAITFSDLYTDACLKALDEFLAGKFYISGDKMTLDDIKVYAAVLEKPAGSFANMEKEQETEWIKAQNIGISVDLVAAAAGEDDDDDLDLFGDETEGKIEVECLNKFIKIAISCLNDKEIERLSMNNAVRGLSWYCSFIKRALEVRVTMGLSLSMTDARLDFNA
ncbi:hypothetical protein C1H46_034481 [Malus baccata]|uniref:GST C-terminal domain-containing protein n=1 Tax=Malus baccata TaxID=106549 RepID=A0A540L0G6_MALBA|nr:hypothetical protein C1H46_034481 [Malus baccata]